MRLQSVMGFGGWSDIIGVIRDKIVTNPSGRYPIMATSMSGFDNARTGVFPNPPAGIFSWDYIKEFVIMAMWLGPQDLSAMSRRTPAEDMGFIRRLETESRKMGFPSYGRYAAALQKSWNWWLGQTSVRHILLQMTPRERGDLLGRMNVMIAFLNRK
jgi:hypothetical protein